MARVSGTTPPFVASVHAAINDTKDIVPSIVPRATNPWAVSPSRTAWLTVGLLWITAALLAWQMRGVSGLGDRGATSLSS